jgi:hypothetical protein
MTTRNLIRLSGSLLLMFLVGAAGWAEPPRYFGIQVVDQATGRGVPLVELESIHQIRWITDSQGWVAIDEPDLMNRRVFFTVRSHGYEFPRDGFGYRGKTLLVEPGGRATLEITRRNLAERLYRVTGSGIYRDSVLLNQEAPIQHPLLNGDVVGCDSVMVEQFQGKLYWFWGDTNRPHYPIGGNFHITGATLPLPDDGQVQPDVGLDLDYITDHQSAIRPVANMPGDGPTWISALTVLRDSAGNQQMLAGYVKIRNQLEAYRWGFVRWDEEAEQFEQLREFDEQPLLFLGPQTHSFTHAEGESEHVYFTNPLPLTRVPADPEAFVDPDRYEGYSCLKAGTRLDDGQLDRDASGRLRYGWKANTPPLTQEDQRSLVQQGLIQPEETRIALRDLDTGRPVRAHSGSVYWNTYRQRWVLITVELQGESSLLGEVWFAEADDITGPWTYARKVVTHDRYTFYNPKHHPYFDADEGRTIYFEGTYTHSFSGNPTTTPRYDYNQVMYRLDLAHADLNLPVPFYPSGHSIKSDPRESDPSESSDVPDPPESSDLSERSETGDAPPWVTRQTDQVPAFYALERPGDETIPVAWDGTRLRGGSDQKALFHALPTNMPTPPPTARPLYELTHTETGRRVYSTARDGHGDDYRPSEQPVCLVWTSGNGATD